MSPNGDHRKQERVAILAVGLFETPLQTDISKIMAANKIDTTNTGRDMYIIHCSVVEQTLRISKRHDYYYYDDDYDYYYYFYNKNNAW